MKSKRTRYRVMAVCGLVLAAVGGGPFSSTTVGDELAEKLSDVPYRIVYETWQDDNWELFSAKADGSGDQPDQDAGRARTVPPRIARRHEDLLRVRRRHRCRQGPQCLRDEHGRNATARWWPATPGSRAGRPTRRPSPT